MMKVNVILMSRTQIRHIKSFIFVLGRLLISHSSVMQLFSIIRCFGNGSLVHVCQPVFIACEFTYLRTINFMKLLISQKNTEY